MLTIIAATVLATVAAQAQPIDVIAFGSCAREREDQPIWSEIVAKNPDLFLFIGDNNYADLWLDDEGKMVMKPVPNVERLHEAYAAQASKPGYRRLQRTCSIMATWDDHDYGANDAGNDYVLREESQDVFKAFYGFRENDPIWDHDGVYHSRTFGPEGQRVQVIMLDTRFFRDQLERGPRGDWGGVYLPTTDTSKTVLGEAQWAWLEKELMKPAEVRIIASSIQVVSDEHRYETWGNFPHERKRLYDLIDATDAAGVVFISGDRHIMDLSRDAERGVPYPMWDFTSSGLTQAPSPVNEPNRFRVGPVMRETNFGVIRITWGETPSTTQISLEGYGDQGQTLTRQSIFLSELSE